MRRTGESKMERLREGRCSRIDSIKLSIAAFGAALLNLLPFCGDPPKSCFEVNTGKKTYDCGDCGKTFSRNYNLKLHLHSHTGARDFCCEYCGKRFARKGVLARHVRAHTGEKHSCCDYCKKSFPDEYQLKVHVRTHTGEKPFECSECLRCFARTNTLRNHSLVHSREKPYQCLVCGREFTQISGVQSHLRSQHGASRSQYKRVNLHGTSLTSKVKVEKSATRIHSTLATGGGRKSNSRQSSPVQVEESQPVQMFKAERNLSCTLCGKLYKYRGNLMNHLLRAHNVTWGASRDNTVESVSGSALPNLLTEDHSNNEHRDQKKVNLFGEEVISETSNRSGSLDQNLTGQVSEGSSHLDDQRFHECDKSKADLLAEPFSLLEQRRDSECLPEELIDFLLELDSGTRNQPSADSDDAQANEGLLHLDGQHPVGESTSALSLEVLQSMV